MPYKDKEEQRAYQLKWALARRAAYFADKVCAKCEAKEELELDHVNPENKVSHRVWTWSKHKRELEITKCQVLCKSCHLDKTISELQTPLIHGTTGGYHKKCRCSACTAAATKAKAAWRERAGRH